MKEGGCRSIKYLHCGSSPGFKAGHGSFMAGTGGMRRAPSSDLNPASLKRGEKKEKFRKKQQREDRRRQEAARTEQQRAELLSSMLPLLLSGPETSWRQASLCLLSFGFSPFLSYFPGSSPGLPQAGPPGHLQVWQTASTPRCLNQTPHPRSSCPGDFQFFLHHLRIHPKPIPSFSALGLELSMLNRARISSLVVLCRINTTALVVFLLFLTQIQVRSVFSSFESHLQ